MCVGVEDRAHREIYRARDEGKATISQLKAASQLPEFERFRHVPLEI